MKTVHFIVVLVIAAAAAIGAYLLANAGVSSLQEEIAQLKKDLKDTNTKLAVAESEIGKLIGMRDKLENDMQALSETCSRLSKQSAELENDQIILASRVKKLFSREKPKENIIIKPPEPSPTPAKFDYNRLIQEAEQLYEEASELFQDAMKLEAGEQRDALLERAKEKSEQAIERFEKISRYYEDNNIRPEAGSKFEWEDLYMKAAQLQYNIVKNMGF